MMNNFSIRSIINLIQFILVFLPIAISGVLIIANPQQISLKIGLFVLLTLFIIANIIQNLIIDIFLKEVRRIINSFSHIEGFNDIISKTTIYNQLNDDNEKFYFSNRFLNLIHTLKKGLNELYILKSMTAPIQNSHIAFETADMSKKITPMIYSQNNSHNILTHIVKDNEAFVQRLDEVQATKKTFAVISSADIPFFNDTFKGAIEAGKNLGVEIVPIAPAWGAKIQASFINNCVQKGIDGIALSPVTSPEVIEAVKIASSKGIKVVTFDNNLPANCGVSDFISTDNLSAGIAVGEATIKHLNGKGTVLISAISVINDNMKSRLNGFRKAIEEYPDIKIVGIQSDLSADVATRVEAIKKYLQTNNDLDCLVYFDYQGGEIIEKLTSQIDLKATVIGFDKTDVAMRLIESGKISCIKVQRPNLWGELAIKRLNELTSGKTVPSFEDSGIFEINKNNISKYM